VARHSPDDALVIAPERAGALASVLLLIVAAAAWVCVLRAPMSADDMAGTAMVMAPTLADAAEYIGGWAVMMTAMMLPSAVPVIALYAVAQRRTESTVARTTAVALFALVYVLLWAATGVPVYFVSLLLMAVAPRTLSYVTAVVLVIAGLYQLSPFKDVCLRHCRSPLGFLIGRWRAGWRGGLAMSVEHALYCVGCCWALMLVLVAAGAMGLPWVLLISALVAAEKLLPGGEWVARFAGVALVLLAVAVAFRPDLVATLRGSHVM